MAVQVAMFIIWKVVQTLTVSVVPGGGIKSPTIIPLSVAGFDEWEAGNEKNTGLIPACRSGSQCGFYEFPASSITGELLTSLAIYHLQVRTESMRTNLLWSLHEGLTLKILFVT